MQAIDLVLDEALGIGADDGRLGRLIEELSDDAKNRVLAQLLAATTMREPMALATPDRTA